ncbi:DsbA family protein [Nocardia brasiliensis]|uniref:DsbA family protein n=1 Tax=Nocardia brasiliensis TaxID=37326 RepID=UPI0018949D04|nr:thioredoxin domain-containing protein [Nocardia brasiliensis]MBF6128602.1 DsbA family protein [Nocardia brasiliensis]
MRTSRKNDFLRPGRMQELGMVGRVCATALVLLLITLVGAGLVGQVRARDRAAAAAAAAVAGPAMLTSDGMIRIGSPNAPVVLTVTEDAQCALCRTLESVSGPRLTALIDRDTIAVDYRMIAIRDRSSTTDYSTRAANASACVAEADKPRWLDWRRAVLERVPAENSPGPSDQDLLDLATRAGIAATPALRDCVTTRRYGAFVANQTRKAIAEKVTHAPTVRIGSIEVGNLTPAGIEAAVVAAR